MLSQKENISKSVLFFFSTATDAESYTVSQAPRFGSDVSRGYVLKHTTKQTITESLWLQF